MSLERLEHLWNVMESAPGLATKVADPAGAVPAR